MTDNLTRPIGVHQLDATGVPAGYAPLSDGSGQYVPGAVAADGGADGTRDRRLGLNLTKQGIVIAKGTGTDFDSDLCESPTILNDPKSGKLAMVYVGYATSGGVQRGSIGLAYSTDGITWTKNSTSAILAGSGVGGDPDQNGCSGPLLLWDDANGQYVLYYIGLTATGYEAGTKTICYATATSLTGTWTRHGAAVSHSGSGWRSTAVWHPSVVERDGTWYMFFNANGAHESIGYATAPAITGPWTVDDVNSPLIDVAASTWEANTVGDPCVRRVGDEWRMDYYGYRSSTDLASDGVATTPDSSFPLGWTKYAANPVLTPGASYDAKYAHKPFIMDRGGVLFHYYTAVDASLTRQIALATEGLTTSSVPTTRQVATDSTLTGGGDLSADRTLGVAIAAELERIQDAVGAMIVAGSNVTAVYDDTAGTLTLSASSGSGTGLVPVTTLDDSGNLNFLITEDGSLLLAED